MLGSLLSSFADQTPRTAMQNLLAQPQVQHAFVFIDQQARAFTAEHIRICEIPAPPFQETERAQYFAQRFTELGLQNVHLDQVGNVIGLYPGTTGQHEHQPLLVVSAHLDTVFPAGTDCTVRREGTRLHAPGIADDCAGLAALIAMIQALNFALIKPLCAIAFVATVGEEGEGDLRGVRHLFTQNPLGKQITNFISFDGPGVDFITHQALGSKRYRITLTGPGGHSWGDFGVVNPVHTLGRIIGKLADYRAPLNPRTTFNVGRIEGGESVNVIPETARLDVDLRSIEQSELDRLEQFLLHAVSQSVTEENSLRFSSKVKIGCEVKMIGHRPTGETPRHAPLVQTAVEASRVLGINPHLNRSSTDSNLPISLGIPAITIGVGGVSADSHRLSEWYDPIGRELGYRRALLLILGMSGIA